jgi:hypothetical protein
VEMSAKSSYLNSNTIFCGPLLTVMKGCPSPPRMKTKGAGVGIGIGIGIGIESWQKVSSAILDCDPDSDPDWGEMCIFTVRAKRLPCNII